MPKARIWSQLTRSQGKTPGTQLCSCHASTWKRAGKNIAWECCNQASLCGKQRKATKDNINRCQWCCLKSRLFAVHILSRFRVIERIRRMEVYTSSLSAEVINIATADQGTTTKQHHILWLFFLMVLTGDKMWPLAWDVPSPCVLGKEPWWVHAECGVLSAHIQKHASSSLIFTCSSHFSLTLSFPLSEQRLSSPALLYIFKTAAAAPHFWWGNFKTEGAIWHNHLLGMVYKRLND